MFKRFQDFVTSQNLINASQPIVVAVSGGVDSMVLLHLFSRWKNLKIKVLHINHNQRGAESEKDARLVQEFCAIQNIPFIEETLDALPAGASEAQMREARYKAFNSVLDRLPTALLATAHHLDDQLETFLMRLATGATINGLRGIPLRRNRFIRPLLSFRRSEIEAYAHKYKIPYRHDTSNEDQQFLRNRVRAKAVPSLIETFGDAFYESFNASLKNIAQHAEDAKLHYGDLFAQSTKLYPGKIKLRRSAYLNFNSLERRGVLQVCISALVPLNSAVSEDLWLSFDRFATQTQSGKQFLIGNSLQVARQRADLVFTAPVDWRLEEKELPVGKSVYWGANIIRCQPVSRDEMAFNRSRDAEYFSCDEVTFPLTVRQWREGDWFIPLGLRERKKLSDFFIDNKLELEDKHRVPVVCSGQQIIWLAGLRLDDRVKVTDSTRQIMKILIEKGETYE